MNRYTIYCTNDQAMTAFELGAPLYLQTVDDSADSIEVFENGIYNYYEIPTAEQMIGFLEDKFSLHFLTGMDVEDKFFINVYYNGGHIGVKGCDTRKKATLAAIDAALEYLSHRKK